MTFWTTSWESLWLQGHKLRDQGRHRRRSIFHSRSAQQLVLQLHISSMLCQLLNTLSCQGNACLMTSSWHASTPLWKVTPFQSWTSWSAACSEKHPPVDHLSAQIANASNAALLHDSCSKPTPGHCAWPQASWHWTHPDYQWCWDLQAGLG